MVYVNPTPNQRKLMLRKQTNFISEKRRKNMHLLKSSEANYVLYKKKFWLDILVKAYTQDDEMSTWFTRIQIRVGLSTPFSTVKGKTKKKRYANEYRNTINDADLQTPLSPIFYWAEGGVCTQANIRMPFTTSAKLLLPGKY